MEQNTQNPLEGLNKQKLYCLIGAGIALVSMLLPWATSKMGFGGSQNGFHSWGLISLLGIAGVAIASFMGDKSKPYEGQMRMVALGSAGAIAGGAFLYLLRIFLGSESTMGYSIKLSKVISPGFGLFICLLVGAAILLFIMGIIKIPDNKPKA
jgi:hypothetical protein